MRLALRRRQRARRPEHRSVLAEVDRHPLEPGADPDDLARRAELVELRGLVVRHAPRQDVRLPQGRRERQALERDERLAQRCAAVDALPGGKEPGQRLAARRLDLPAQAGERSAPQPPEHVGVAPLALGAAGPKLAAHEPVLGLEPRESFLGVRPEPRHRLGGRERPAAAGKADEQEPERVLPALEERVGQPRRRHRTEGVAVAPGVLGGDQAVLAGHAHGDRAPLGQERLGERLVVGAGQQVAAAEQEVVQLVGRAAGRRAARPRPAPRRRRRAGRAAPPRRAARGAGRGRARAPARGARRAACRPRTCRSRRSRRGATTRTARRTAVSTSTRSTRRAWRSPRSFRERRQVEDVLQALAVRSRGRSGRRG